MTPEHLNLLIQGGLVGIFAAFVIIWSDRTARSQAARDELASKAQSDRDVQMQDFWKELRKEDREVMAKLIYAVDCLDKSIGDHSSRTEKDHAIILDRLDKKPPRTQPRSVK